jgi:DNA-binding response OmpR family regulator
MTKRLLIVDDNEIFGEALTEYLRELGFHAHFAPDGMSALMIAERMSFHLVVSDIKMPGIDGYTLCHELIRLYNIPTILMSGYIDEKDVERMAPSAFSAILVKPFAPDELERRINAVLAPS